MNEINFEIFINENYKEDNYFIIGSNPTMEMIRFSNLFNGIKIGLNNAWKFTDVDYGVTIHPDVSLLSDSEKGKKLPNFFLVGLEKYNGFKKINKTQINTKIVTFKYRYQKNSAKVNDPSNSGRCLELIDLNNEYLYNWSSISQTAMHLAYKLGAKNIFLVGCEAISFGKHHNLYKNLTRWKGVSPEYRYDQYVEGNLEVAMKLREKGLGIYTLTPFVGMRLFDKQYEKFNIKINQEKPESRLLKFLKKSYGKF